MRKNKGLYAVILAVVLAVSLFVVGCKEPTTQPPAVTVTLSQSSVELEPSATVQLTATVTGIENPQIEWSSSDSAVARVDGGLVTAMAVGDATVTAKVGDASTTCSVTVRDNAVPLLSFGRDKVELVVGGDPIPVTATVTYNGAAVEADVNWTSNDTSIVTVANGILTPVAVGNTTVTASATYLGKDAEATIPVKVVSSSRVSISSDSLTLTTYQNTSAQVTAELLINSVKVDGATFTAEVTEGDAVTATADGNTVTVTAVAVGKATVTVTGAKDDTTLSTQIEVTVTRGVVETDIVYTVNIKNGNAALDFSAYDWNSEVEGMYDGNKKISIPSGNNVLNAEWLATQTADTQKFVEVKLRDRNVRIALSFIDQCRVATFKNFVDNGNTASISEVEDPTKVGFTAFDRVQEYNSGSSSGWYALVEATVNGERGDIQNYAFWSFDIIYANEVTAKDGEYAGQVWVGAHHPIYFNVDGTTHCEDDSYAGGTQYDTCCLTITDANGDVVTQALEQGVRYTFTVDLRQHSQGGYYLFGCKRDPSVPVDKVYIGNSIVCTEEWYRQNVADRYTRVTLDKTTASALVGETVQLTASVTEANGNTTRWTSSDNAIATVNQNGLVTAHKKGTAIITATVGKANASCTVTVDNKVEMTVDKTQTVVRIGETGTVTATVKLNGQAVSDAVIEWTSANAGIATVSGGTVTGVATGDTTVTAACTYDGKPVSVTVDVRIVEQQRVALKMNGSEVTGAQLVTYAADGKYSIATLSAEMIDNDVPVAGATFSAQVTSGDAVAVEVTGSTVTVTAVASGSATVTVTGSKDGTQKSTTLTVTVERTVLATTASVTADVGDPHAKLDFGKYVWYDAVTALYDGNTDISTDGNGLQLGWLKTQTSGQTKTLKAVLGNGYMYDVTFTVSFVNLVKPVTFKNFVDNGNTASVTEVADPALVGFTAADRVQKYDSGSNSGWYGLVEATVNGERGDIQNYAFWSFDVIYANDVTAPDGEYAIQVWTGAHHIARYKTDGTTYCFNENAANSDTCCLTITDANGNAVTGTMQKNVRYTFTIDLREHSQGGYYLFGCNRDKNSVPDRDTVYIGNSVVYPSAYFDAIAPVKHTATQYDTATFTVNVDDVDWKDDITGIYENGVRISAENSTVLNAAWVNHSAVGTHTAEIRRTSGNPITAAITVSENSQVHDATFFIGKVDGGNDSIVSAPQDGSEVDGFTAGERVQKLQTVAGGWSSIFEVRTNGNRGSMKNYDYWVYDAIFDGDLSEESNGEIMYYFMGGDSTKISVHADGTVYNLDGGASDRAQIYNSDGSRLTAKPQKGVRYTFVVDLSEHWADNYCIWGIQTANLTLHVGNSIACSQDYYNANIAPRFQA